MKKNINTPLSSVIVLLIYITAWIFLACELIFAMDDGWYGNPIQKHYFTCKIIGLILFVPFYELFDYYIISRLSKIIENIKTNRNINAVIKRQEKNNGLKKPIFIKK